MPWRVKLVPVTASTNDDVRVAAEAGEAEGLVIQALRQSAGRGRRGRGWESPEGNLYFSALLRPTLPASEYAKYSFIAALALHDALRSYLPSDIKLTLKWPNDVLVERKKISGILLESGDGFLIMGIGLNVAASPENPLHPATTLQAHVKILPSLDDVLSALLSSLCRWQKTLQQQGFAPVRDAWLQRAQRGKVSVRLPTGTIEGEMLGVDEQGALRLWLANGSEKAISVGDIFFPES